MTFLVLCLISIYVLYPTDERRIIRVVNKSEDAIVSEDIDKLMENVAYNYKDDHGNGYFQIKEILKIAFKRLNDLEVEKNITKISVKENAAEVELSVRVIALEGEDKGYIIGDAVQAATIKVFFEKSSYKWLITKVEGVFEKSRGAFLENSNPSPLRHSSK